MHRIAMRRGSGLSGGHGVAVEIVAFEMIV